MGVEFEPLRITGVVVEEIGVPRNDGTRGSALYSVPFKLSRRAPEEWCRLFVEAWNHGGMHRRDMAWAAGDRIVLEKTTIEDVEQHHQETLKVAVRLANEGMQRLLETQEVRAEGEKKEQESHGTKVREVAGRLRFDDE